LYNINGRLDDILIRFGFKGEIPEDLEPLIASFLHDVIEDTARSYSDLKKDFGINVAEIVYCMTDELGRNRKEKKQKTYPKIRSNLKSVILKLADRIANVEHSIKNKNSGFVDMYHMEHEDFQTQLRVYKHADEMWEHLNSLFKGQK
jgi:(p)ppGpp synthase/HD superfamily hydrolase